MPETNASFFGDMQNWQKLFEKLEAEHGATKEEFDGFIDLLSTTTL
ncbi:MAG: hypothetical protein FWG10_13185 [Eubacteriaceae bacterium]|nr:hypothetical protein [Eubacteriaceae bacterium]